MKYNKKAGFFKNVAVILEQDLGFTNEAAIELCFAFPETILEQLHEDPGSESQNTAARRITIQWLNFLQKGS